MGAGKWIGGILGFITAGPLGALAGVALGALFENGLDAVNNPDNSGTRSFSGARTDEEQRNSFMFSLMVLSSYIIKADGKVILMDEIHTPDSSRYFYADGYQEKFEKGEPQKQLSKEFVRQWLIENGFMGKEGQQVPEMTDEYCETVSQRYIELYEDITGKKFVPCADEDLAARIEKNVSEYLKTL